jgi:N-acetylglucosamine transport system substrate-binding protein
MRRLWSRILHILITAIFLAFISACCNSSNHVGQNINSGQNSGIIHEASWVKANFSNTELEIAVFQGGYSKDYWDSIILKFEEAYPGTKVHMTINPQIGQIITPSVVSGNPPDFISLNDIESSGLVLSLIREKGLTDLTDFFNEKALDREKAIKDMIIPGVLDTVKFSPYQDGRIYLAPFNYGSTGLVYNKNLFKKRGWVVPNTWDEFFALGDIAKKEGRDLFTYQGIYPTYLELVLWPAIANSCGMDTLNRIYNYEKGSFENDKVKKVLQILDRITSQGYLMKGTVALNHTQAQTEMMQGKALFIPCSSWIENEMKNAPREEGFEFGLAPVPTFNQDDKHYAAITCEQFSIPAKAKNPALAREFLKFLYSDISVELFADKSDGVFALKHARELVKYKLSKTTDDFFSILDDSTPIIDNWAMLPKNSKISIQTEIFAKCIPLVMNKQMTIDMWMNDVEKVFAQARDEINKSRD